VKYIHQKWRHKLEDDFAYWAPSFPVFAESIRRHANTKGTALTQGNFSVAAFIDCNITETCRPGSGPDGPGPGAPRRDPNGNIQKAFYTGWLHLHGIKHQVCAHLSVLHFDRNTNSHDLYSTQVVMAPNGMILMIWGPCTVRRNDLHALAMSAVLQKWSAAMIPGHVLYVLYGDSIYPWRPELRFHNGGSC